LARHEDHLLILQYSDKRRDTGDAPVSHGVCKSGYTRVLTEHGFNLKKFLDMLDAPVFLVDDDVNVLAANSLAIAIVKNLLKGPKCSSAEMFLNVSMRFFRRDVGRLPSVPIVLL